MEFVLKFEHADESVDRGLISQGSDGLGKGRLSFDTATTPLCRRNMGRQRKGATGTGVMIERQGVVTGMTKMQFVITYGATQNTASGIE
jgi:hypothetical protein